MAEQKEDTALLVSISSALAEIKEAQKTTNSELTKARSEISELRIGQTQVEERLKRAQSDITERAHKNEVERIRQDLARVECEVAFKASNRLMWWVLGVTTALMLATAGAILKVTYIV